MLLYYLFRDKRVIVFAAVGSVLPDLVDKPLGYIILGETIGSGRIFFHGFWLMLIFMVLGVIVLIRLKNPLVLSLSIGVLVHQLEDSMWKSPVNWFWPLLGPYSYSRSPSDYFLQMLLKELTTPEEIFCGILVFFGLVVYYLSKKDLI
ncbi:membrane-bound metal-dependent hydrolase YbcI (DUF457 family) [Methanomicrobium sp. W14]|nr:membrane-bound metal-dependent hydrolase YbcI (DUF457 family) [Methanomicrobium sp. W14]